MTYVINGPTNGYGVIFGNTSGSDIINAFADFNDVISEGANDTINLLGNDDTVYLGSFTGVTDTVNSSGSNNTIMGTLTSSTVSVNGGTGEATVTLTNTGGTTNVSVGGYFNNIEVNADATNTIVSGAGNATVSVGPTGGSEGAGWSTSITLGGTSNTVTGASQNTSINGGLGFDTITLGNGNNTIKELGDGNNITVGYGANTIWAGSGGDTVTIGALPAGVPPPTDTVYLSGANDTVTSGDENVNVSGSTGSATIGLGNGDNSVAISGADNLVTAGNGNNVVSISGPTGSNMVGLGNGDNSVTVAGANNLVVVGTGDNTISAKGNGNVVYAGVSGTPATSPDTITVGSDSSVWGYELASGSVINSVGSSNFVTLDDSSSATIHDKPTGTGLETVLTGNASGDYFGDVKLTGFGHDLLNGTINLTSVDGGVNGAPLDSLANILPNISSNGHGGFLVSLAGGGVLDVTNSSFTTHTFAT
jgi:hypothetical protein